MTLAGDPTPEQRAAVEAIDRDVLLAAGAGTGKTRVLADRYSSAVTDLLADGVEHPLDAILAFTFTERAAAELRERVRSTLERLGHTELARGLSRGWVSTIHGFCRRLLTANPTLVGLDPRFRVLDAAEADRLANRAFDAALESFLAGGGPERALLLAVFRIPALQEAVLAIHAELRSQGREPELPPAPDPDPTTAIEALRRAAAAAADECRDGAGTPLADEYRRRIDAAASLPLEPLPSSSSVAVLVLAAKADDFTRECAQAYDQAVKAAAKALLEHESRDQYELLRELLAVFAEEYAGLKGERSGLDFEDLQLQAVRLLEEHPTVREAYQRRFRHLMVDEFQDTNLLQLKLIRLLEGPETQMFAVGDELQAIYGFRHADVAVFRGERERMRAAPEADSVVLPLSGSFRSTPGVLAAINALGGHLIGDAYWPLTVGIEPEQLECPAALDREPDLELLVVPAKGQKSAWTERAAELGLSYAGDKAPAASRVAEARMLAARLRDLADAGVPQRSMVVLLRALTPVAAIEQELRRAGLEPYVVGGRGYWQQQQVEDVRRFLEAAANPLDDLALLGLLSSPACGVLPDTLWLLRQVAGNGRFWPTIERYFGDGGTEPDPGAREWIDAIPAADTAKLRKFCPWFTGLRREAPALGLDELIDRIVSDTGYDLSVLAREDGARRMANIRKLMRMARSHEAVEGRDLRGFLDHLDERSSDASEGEAAVEAEGRDVVRIMTVHAAKGLEFPVVAFADLGRRPHEGSFPPAFRVGRNAPPASENGAEPESEEAALEAANRVGVRMARFGAKWTPIYDYDQLTEEAEEEAVRETLRLAHVAVTRGQCHLILSGRVVPSALTKEEDANAPVIDRLLRAFSIDLGGEEPPEDWSGSDEVEVELPPAEVRDGLDPGLARPGRMRVQIARPDREWAESVSRAGPVPETEPEGPVSTPLVRPLPEAAPPLPSRLSYTALAEFERCGLRFYFERLLGVEGDALYQVGEGAGRRIGSAVHALLEWSARHAWALPTEEDCRAALEREGVEAGPEAVATCRGSIERWLGSELCAEIRRNYGEPRAEVPFALSIAGGLITGSIDLLARRDDGEPLVIDYKTDSTDDPETLVEDRYARQRDIYALAAAADATSVDTAYVVLNTPGEPVRKRYRPEELDAARARITELVEKAGSGRFEAAEPSEELCAGCPARARMCPRWEWREGRLAPASEVIAA